MNSINDKHVRQWEGHCSAEVETTIKEIDSIYGGDSGGRDWGRMRDIAAMVVEIRRQASASSAGNAPTHPTGITFEKWLSYQPWHAPEHGGMKLYLADTVKAAWMIGHEISEHTSASRPIEAAVHSEADTFVDAVSAMQFPKGWEHVAEEAERIRSNRASHR